MPGIPVAFVNVAGCGNPAAFINVAGCGRPVALLCSAPEPIAVGYPVAFLSRAAVGLPLAFRPGAPMGLPVGFRCGAYDPVGFLLAFQCRAPAPVPLGLPVTFRCASPAGLPVAFQCGSSDASPVGLPVAFRCAAIPSPLEAGAIEDDARVQCGGVEIDYLSCEWGRDLGEPFWSCTLDLPGLAEYAKLKDGVFFTVQAGGQAWLFRVNDPSRSADEDGPVQYRVTGISPGAWLAFPRCNEVVEIPPGEAQTAHHLAAAALGEPIDWRLPLWTVPQGAFAVSDSSPVDAASVLVDRVGGILRQTPGGQWEAVPEFQSPPSTWAAAPFQALFTAETDLFVIAEQVHQGDHYGRITVSNDTPEEQGDQPQFSDSLEFRPDDGNDRHGWAIATLKPWRDTPIIASTSEDVWVGETTSGSESVTEAVVFQEGKGSVSRPCSGVSSLEWIGAGLAGGVTFDPDGTELRIADTGVAAAMVTYNVRFRRAEVTALIPLALEAQRLLVLEN